MVNWSETLFGVVNTVDSVIMEGCSIRAAEKRDFLRVSEYMMLQKALCGGNDQITMTAPLPVCSAKLSIVEPG